MSNTQQEIAALESTNEQKLTTNSKQVKQQTDNARIVATKKVTYTAIFIALALVMKLIGKALTITDSITITFIYIPWLLSGVILGPLCGCLVGLTSDVLGNLIFVGMAGFNPLTLLSNTLYALPIALLYKTNIKSDYLKVILGSTISLFVCTLGIGSFAIYWYYGYIQYIGYFQWFIASRLLQPIILVVNVVILCIMVKPLQNFGLYPVQSSDSTNKKDKLSISSIIITAILAISAIVLSTVTGNGSLIGYIMVSSIAIIVGFCIWLSSHTITNDKLMLNGIILLITGALTAFCAIIIAISKVNIYTFVPNFWMYIFALIPLTLTVAMLIPTIKKKYTMSNRSLCVFMIGHTLTILSTIFFIVILTLKILLII